MIYQNLSVLSTSSFEFLIHDPVIEIIDCFSKPGLSIVLPAALPRLQNVYPQPADKWECHQKHPHCLEIDH